MKAIEKSMFYTEVTLEDGVLCAVARLALRAAPLHLLICQS